MYISTPYTRFMLDANLNPNAELDYFKFTINSGDDASFILPTISIYGADYNYDWKVNWGDSTESIHTGTGGTGGVLHKYPSINTNYQITVYKNNSSLKWLSCFGFSDAPGWGNCNDTDNRRKMISLDSPFTLNMFLENPDASNVNNLFAYMFYHNFNLTTMNNFNFLQNIISIGTTFGYYMFESCSSLTNNTFQLPQKLININNGFCGGMFAGCRSLTTGIQYFFGNLQLSQTELDKGHVFDSTFVGCLSIVEEISPNTIPQLEISPSVSNNCFSNCPEDMVVNCPDNWK